MLDGCMLRSTPDAAHHAGNLGQLLRVNVQAVLILMTPYCAGSSCQKRLLYLHFIAQYAPPNDVTSVRRSVASYSELEQMRAVGTNYGATQRLLLMSEVVANSISSA
jgi:hypothetical protein